MLHQDEGGIGESIPSALEISLRLRPREISLVLENLSGVRDGFLNTSLVLVEHGYIADDNANLGEVYMKCRARLIFVLSISIHCSGCF